MLIFSLKPWLKPVPIEQDAKSPKSQQNLTQNRNSPTLSFILYSLYLILYTLFLIPYSFFLILYSIPLYLQNETFHNRYEGLSLCLWRF